MKNILITAATAALIAGSAMAGSAPTEYEAPVQNDDDFAAVPVASSVSGPVVAGVGAAVLLAAILSSDSSSSTTTTP